MTPSEVLERSKTRLIERGWAQGLFGGSAGPNCVSGVLICFIREALDANLIERSVLNRDGEQYFKYLRQAIQSTCIIAWNDTPGRTFSEVMNAFDEAILLAKEDECES